MICDAKLKHNDLIFDVKVSLGKSVIFIFKNSLPDNIIPQINDYIILDFESTCLSIKSVTPLISENNEFSNYALNVELA